MRNTLNVGISFILTIALLALLFLLLTTGYVSAQTTFPPCTDYLTIVAPNGTLCQVPPNYVLGTLSDVRIGGTYTGVFEAPIRNGVAEILPLTYVFCEWGCSFWVVAEPAKPQITGMVLNFRDWSEFGSLAWDWKIETTGDISGSFDISVTTNCNGSFLNHDGVMRWYPSKVYDGLVVGNYISTTLVLSPLVTQTFTVLQDGELLFEQQTNGPECVVDEPKEDTLLYLPVITRSPEPVFVIENTKALPLCHEFESEMLSAGSACKVEKGETLFTNSDVYVSDSGQFFEQDLHNSGQTTLEGPLYIWASWGASFVPQ
ncbi:hypothetical protein COV24_03685 [candidate division WWE3 bacterium CG10_big_fil_rev_8_21_14_0_10_32_10]|uniref:Uncharacterized protein n=1 Tax=candidate division WWE3 bacterium CG10_big_fil_rev_8_21_14_0_10_32_10 TaxID=1975090 RepID=A0A2H0RA99_UNCKA|nr:MAG: hypothetical protein COV24_03685 [candidate division WWE3 bacterium CG10_big_fil_rev_8_21_14_0_10_32_10]